MKAGIDGVADRGKGGETQSCEVTHEVAKEEHASASLSILPDPL